MGLKRQRKEDQIVADILGEIRRGTLAGGDRLASVSALRRRYRTAQRTVESAIAELAGQGVVETVPRSGTYIRHGFRMDDIGPAQPAADETQFLDFLVPRSPARQSLTLFLSEVSPCNLDLWREVLDGFDGCQVDLVTCRDGRVEDLFPHRHVDILQTTPYMLETIGNDHFVPLEQFGVMGGDWYAQLLPIVRERMEAGPAITGMPFSVTVRYLYVNLDLFDALGLRELPASPLELYSLAADVQNAARARGADSLLISAADNPLWICGALRWEHDALVADVERAREFFTRLAAGRLPVADLYQGSRRFPRGELLFLPHCSYESAGFRQRADCRWRAYPMPAKNVPPLPGWLTVLAVNRQASHPDRALELVRYLSGPQVQARFAEVHGNLSVLREPTLRCSPTNDGTLPAETVRRALDQTTLRCPLSVATRISSACSMVGDLRQLREGAIDGDEMTERFRCLTAFINSSPKAR